MLKSFLHEFTDDIEKGLLNKRSCDQSSSTPPSSKRPTNRDEVNDESSSRESSISSQRQERGQHKRQRTDEEDNSDYDDNITTSITKRQPPRSDDIELESHDQSTRSHGKEPGGGRPYKRKRRPDSVTTSQLPTRSPIVSILFYDICTYYNVLVNIIIPPSILYVSCEPNIVSYVIYGHSYMSTSNNL